MGIGCLKAEKEQCFCNDVAQVKSKICGGRQKDKFLIKTDPAPALNQERKSIKLSDLEQRYLSRLILSWCRRRSPQLAMLNMILCYMIYNDIIWYNDIYIYIWYNMIWHNIEIWYKMQLPDFPVTKKS